MSTAIRTFAALLFVAPLAAGCAGRTAPFDDMDKAQITVLRLGGQPAPVMTAPMATGPGMIPGVPPELQAAAQQALAGIQAALPPGVLPPGLIPGATQQPTAMPQQQQPTWKGFVIVAQMPLTDQTTKDDLLDVFGDESAFQDQKGPCFSPGMGVAMVRPNAPEVDLLISLSCNQAQGDGFKWPYKKNGFTQDTSQKLTKIYEKLWGPVPPNA